MAVPTTIWFLLERVQVGLTPVVSETIYPGHYAHIWSFLLINQWKGNWLRLIARVSDRPCSPISRATALRCCSLRLSALSRCHACCNYFGRDTLLGWFLNITRPLLPTILYGERTPEDDLLRRTLVRLLETVILQSGYLEQESHGRALNLEDLRRVSRPPLSRSGEQAGHFSPAS